MGRRRVPKPVRKSVVRYELADGTRCSKSAPGAIKKKTLTDAWYYRQPGKAGEARPYVPLGTTDQMAAWERLRDILRRERERDAGIRSPLLDHAERSIGEHLSEWLETVQGGKADPRRVAMMRTRVTELARLAGWTRISEISRPSCTRALTALEKEPGSGSAAKGRSVQTRNHYLSHVRQFVRWLVEEGRLAKDALAGMEPLGVEGSERHRRRCPGDEEIRLLFLHLHSESAPVRYGMSGPHRALAYETAMATGYRGGELRKLGRANFSEDFSTVRLGAASDKARRRREAHPVPSWLAAKLRAWTEAGGALFDGLPADGAGKPLKKDLQLARQLWLAEAKGAAEKAARSASQTLLYQAAGIDGPEFWDFHSLRHWYVTEISGQEGISPATLQALSRHSDPKLTLERYAHARSSGKRSAADSIRQPGKE